MINPKRRSVKFEGNMEKKTFNFYRLRWMELTEKVKEAADMVTSAPDPLSLISFRDKLKFYRTRADIIRQKMEEYGGGTIIQVSGEYFQMIGDTETHKSFERRRFTMYLNCDNIQDAEDVFNSQVSGKYEFDKASIKFNTIQLKSLLT